MNKVRVAFICVHNSCRSQIAEALGKVILRDVADVYSAGTETKDRINQDAVRLMKELYGVDMEEAQCPKLIEQLPTINYVVTMGCNVDCPLLPCDKRSDWGLADPSGKADEDFIRIIDEIANKLNELKSELTSQSKNNLAKKPPKK